MDAKTLSGPGIFTQDMSRKEVAEWFKDNPRMHGVLFALLLMIMKTGQVAAVGTGHAGP